VPVAIFRRKAKSTMYAWAIAPDGAKNDIEHIASPGGEVLALRVTTPQGPVVLHVDSKAKTVAIKKESSK